MKRLSISFFSCIHLLWAKVLFKKVLYGTARRAFYTEVKLEVKCWTRNEDWKKKNSFDDLNVQVNSIWSLLCLYIIEIIDFLQQWDINIFNYSATMLRWYRQHAHVSSLSIETAHISRYLSKTWIKPLDETVRTRNFSR